MLRFNRGGPGKSLLLSAGLIALIAQSCSSDAADDHAATGGAGGAQPGAGQGGTSGAVARAGNAGKANGSAGDWGAEAGAAGNSDGIAGSGGADAALGGSAGTAGEAGNGATSTALSVSTDTLQFVVTCPGPAIVAAKTFTVSNPSDAALTWSATSPATWFSIAPASGTLAAGAHADITISPKRWDPPHTTPATTELKADVTVASDEASQLVQVSESNGGLSFSVIPPANVDLGLAVVHGLTSLSIVADPSWVDATLTSSNTTDFGLSGLIPGTGGIWLLQFKPGSVGAHTTTLTIGSTTKCVLAPNTFTAQGTAIIN